MPGRHPHPGRGDGTALEAAAPEPRHRHALDLFNHGFYWEAHEAWEGLWRTCGRQSPEGRLLSGLIALAAAGVKAREGNRRGVVRHARRAAALFGGLRADPPNWPGPAAAGLTAFAVSVAAAPPCRPAADGAPPEIVFDAVLAPG